MANLGTLMEGTLSQIFHLRLSFHFITKNRETLCIFLKLNFLDYIKFDLEPKKIFSDMVPSIIVLRATRENLNIIDRILTEISAIKNIRTKIKFLIYFSLYL